jgi:hypothetical protein
MRKSLKVVAFGGDPADTFLKAAGITDATITSAVKTLVRGLQADGLWSKMNAIYPMVGGNANAHSYNLKDITKFQITWSGGLTHSSTGVLPNGTNGYGNTGLTPSLSLLKNSTSVSFYSRTNTNTGWDFGSAGGSSYSNIIAGNIRYSDIYFYPTNDTTYNITVYNGSGLGYFIQSRTGASTVSAFKNSSKLVTGTSPSASSLSAYPIFLFTFNNMGSPFTYGNKECAFFSIGDGLSDTDASNLYTRIQTFQTTLNRFVGTPIYPSFDSDAQSFMTSASITDSTQQAAVNYLVTDLKANNLWTKMKALYPMVGGTATKHSYNLKNPAQYQITFNGGWTHSSNGALPNGTNAYADTLLNPLTSLTSSLGLSYYSRTNANTSLDQVDIGVIQGSDYLYLTTQYNASGLTNRFFGRCTTNTIAINTANADAKGYYYLGKTGNGANLFKSFKNGAIQDTQTGAGVNPNNTVYIGASNSLGAAAFYTNRECAFATIGEGLSDSEASTLYTIIQNYQTILSRQV